MNIAESTTLTATEIAKKESTAQMMWVGIIVAFFSIQAVLWAVAITLTHNDPTNGIVEDYDRKAMNWNELRKQALDSQQLGWVWAIAIGDKPSYGDERTVTLTLTNRDGQPLENAEVYMEVFHRARSAEVQKVNFIAVEKPGVYQATLELRKPGNWQFDTVIVHAEERFVGKQTVGIQ